MALDTLQLGQFTFTDFAVPHEMPFGGRQHLIVHKMPGGNRAVDVMGPDDDDRTWHGILWGDNAFANMLGLDAMRRQGKELTFSWAGENRTCVIAHFEARVEKPQCIHYEITIVFTDNSPGEGTGFFRISLTDQIKADATSAKNVFANGFAGGTA